MMFCRKPQKTCEMHPMAKGAVALLAAAGVIAIADMIRRRGKRTADALMRAGCRCKKAAKDAMEEIVDCSCENG